MTFPLGRSVAVLAALAVLTGVWQFAALPPRRADLTVWCFAQSHADSFRDPAGPRLPSLVEEYQRRTGRSVEVKLINARALDTRLLSLFASDARGREVPDVAEIEVGAVGKYFRAPADQIGFLPLNDFLSESGLGGQIVASRFAPWSKGGLIFGVPHDVHPVAITYRKDLFDAAGVDLAAARTWADFQAKCLTYQKVWAARGVRRRAVELSTAASDQLALMLLQRGINLIDAEGNVHLADAKTADTVAFYARLVAGDRAVGTDTSRGGAFWAGDLAAGDICAALTPDWRVGELKRQAPELAGKLALMPLPRFDPTDAPTATWGGTMFGIPRNCRDPRASWALMKFLLFSREGLAARRRTTDILPPLRPAWSDPAYHRPDPFFGGQKSQELLIALAEKIPPRVQTPFTGVASAELTSVLLAAEAAVAGGADEAALMTLIHSRLADAQADVERRIAFGTFE